MKKIIVALLLSSFYLPAIAQDVNLTKGETVAYLNKKFKEIEGYPIWGEGGEPYIAKDCSVEFKDGILIITHTKYRSVKDFCKDEYKFNPSYIKEIRLADEKEEIANRIIIDLPLKSVRYQRTFPSNYAPWPAYLRDYVHIYFYKGDGKNFEKIKKALLHLQALLKAEDDPFGN